MRQEEVRLNEQLHKSRIHQQISLAKRNHPDCVVVYFVRHRDAPPQLPKPTTPLLLFQREMRVEEVMYALYQQIQFKGLAFYVLKPEKDNRVRYMLVQPGPTIGQVFDQFSKDDYLSLIYHNSSTPRKISSLERRIIRFAVILAVIWVVLYAYPMVRDYLDPPPVPAVPLLPDFEES